MADMLVMRHAEAEPGHPDQTRCLTPAGEREAEKMARWLAERVKAGEQRMPNVYVSPFTRAQQTAQTLCDALGTTPEILSFITPDGAPSAVSDWLLEQPEGTPIMLISHMPLVGSLVGLLVEGRPDQGVGFPTASIAELRADVWAAGCAQLTRFTHPHQF